MRSLLQLQFLSIYMVRLCDECVIQYLSGLFYKISQLNTRKLFQLDLIWIYEHFINTESNMGWWN